MKKDSGTGVFLWILQNLKEHLQEHLWWLLLNKFIKKYDDIFVTYAKRCELYWRLIGAFKTLSDI